jgi:hypothetical protein
LLDILTTCSNLVNTVSGEDDELEMDEEEAMLEGEYEESAWTAYYRGVMALFGGYGTVKSRSLDDLAAAVADQEKKQQKGKKKNPKLKETGRSSTYEDKTATATLHEEEEEDEDEDLVMEFEPDEEEDEEMEDYEDLPDDLRRDKGLLREIRKTVSASLRSLDMSVLRSAGSLSSLSSGKSLVSNFSVQSDSGVRRRRRGRRATAGRFSTAPPATTPNVVPPPGGRKRVGPRTWDSEPLLEHTMRQPRTRGDDSASSSVTSLQSLAPGEKEKSKAMLSVESKLMKSIKEVNESDLSENSTPINSPGPLLIVATASPLSMTPSPLATPRVQGCSSTETETVSKTGARQQTRPSLVKQRQSFQFPDCTDQEPKVENESREEKPKIEDGTDAREEAEKGTKKGEIKDESAKSKKMVKQSSLDVEFMSRDRVQANVEMRKKIQRQYSLPSNQPDPEEAKQQQKSFKESLMAVTRSKQFESLKAGISSLVGKQQQQEAQQPEPIEDCKAVPSLAPSERSEKTCDPKNASSSSAPPTPQIGMQQYQGSTAAAFGSGIVRIWQSLSSTRTSDDPAPVAVANPNSFTHKRGVTIQPLVVDGGATTRRNLFQRRSRGSPNSPKQQIEVIAKEGMENR